MDNKVAKLSEGHINNSTKKTRGGHRFKKGNRRGGNKERDRSMIQLSKCHLHLGRDVVVDMSGGFANIAGITSSALICFQAPMLSASATLKLFLITSQKIRNLRNVQNH